MKNDTRPVFQAVFKYRYPVMAIASIFHRISGVLLFLLLPLLLWALHYSLASAEGFSHLHDCLTCPLAVAILWIFLAALLYHLVAGIRHLLMDIGIGESLKGGRLGAYLTFIITFILLIIIGIFI